MLDTWLYFALSRRSMFLSRCRGSGLRGWRLQPRCLCLGGTGDPSNLSQKTTRTNPMGVQMLSKPLYDQLFGKGKGSDKAPSKAVVEKSIRHLTEQGLWGKSGVVLEDVDIDLPPIQGKNLDQHFRTISIQQSKPYFDMAVRLVRAKLPPMPAEWTFKSGWTRYDPVTGCGVGVDYPADDAMVLDVETCVLEGQRPILAVAASPKAWYSWSSLRLTADLSVDLEHHPALDELIPIEPLNSDGEKQHQRLVVGHNVSYDRARIREQYSIKGPETRFLDTLSLHVCVAGQTSGQKVLWKKSKTLQKDWMGVSSPNSLADVHWLHVSKGTRKLDKTQRNVFVNGSVQDIRDDFQNLMRYCAVDVFSTHEVLQVVFPLFMSRCPHPVTFAGMLEMGSAYLPLDASWDSYITDAEHKFEEMEKEMSSMLDVLAINACAYMHHERYLKSPWMCCLDWNSKAFRGKTFKTKAASKKLVSRLKALKEEEEEDFAKDSNHEEKEVEFVICSLKSMLSTRPVHMPGYPEWYRQLCMKRHHENWRPGPVNITAQTRVTPYLLKMKWKGHPLHFHAQLGWGYIISPDLQQGETPTFADVELECSDDSGLFPAGLNIEEMRDLVESDLDVIRDGGGVKVSKPKKEEEDWHPQTMSTVWGVTNDLVTLPNGDVYYYFKIPHKSGMDANVGNPLSIDYLPVMEDGTLTSGAGKVGQYVLILNSMVSFWRSSRKRIMEQFVVNLKGSGAESAGLSAIVPQMQVAGTVTRRAVESTWLTASNPKGNRVGSELKSMVRAPPGYHMVGADVDSQELWIAAVLGDMHFTGIHGSTGVGWMTLQGTKTEGTDVHSTTAKAIGISRDQAKILNYGRIYGAGKPFIELLLRQFNPSMSKNEVAAKANTLYSVTKGRRMYKLNKEGQEAAKEMGITLQEGCGVFDEDWKLLCSGVGYMRANYCVVEKVWSGGSESHLFNKLESIAMSQPPRTPVLGCSISRALEPKYVGNSYHTSKVNWVVQSSAVDYLHLMLVSMRWLFDKYDIDGRYCISIHDEVRYLVKSEDRYRAGLALHLTNLLTRAMFAYKLKMFDLPQSVAFFSAVDVDEVLRKEPTSDCTTPSNPLGLEERHGIPPGEGLDIYQLLQKAGHSLQKPSEHSSHSPKVTPDQPMS